MNNVARRALRLPKCILSHGSYSVCTVRDVGIAKAIESANGWAGLVRRRDVCHAGNAERSLLGRHRAYAVLGFAAVFEGISWTVALREFRLRKGRLGYFEAFRQSKDPSTFTVLLEDSAALLGLLIAFLGVLGTQLFGEPRVDGVASIGIAFVLGTSSILLARESKGLLIGEPAHAHVRESILRIAASDPAVRHANDVLTVQMGPSQIVAALSAEFEDALDTSQIEACVCRIEDLAKAMHPDLTTLFVKPQTSETWSSQRPPLLVVS